MPTALKPPCLGEHLRLLATVSTPLSLLLNFILYLLIRFKTTKELRAYSRVLLCNCLADSAFTVVSFLMQMVSGESMTTTTDNTHFIGQV